MCRPLPADEYTVFIRPTDLQLAVYREALGNSAIKTMLEGFDVKTGISLLQTLLKLATSPGLLLKQIKVRRLPCFANSSVVRLTRVLS